MKKFVLVGWCLCALWGILGGCAASHTPLARPSASLALPGTTTAVLGATPTEGNANTWYLITATPPAGTRTDIPRLTAGPIVGAVTASAAHIFVQTSPAASVVLEYGATPNLSDAHMTPAVQTGALHDFSTQIALDALAANTLYYVNVLVNGQPQFVPPYPSFKTFPPQGQNSDFKFVILNDFFWTPSLTFRNAAQEHPDLVVIGGDFSHDNPTTAAEKRALFTVRYDPNGKDGDMVKYVLWHSAVAHMWDDHDYGLNNADKTYPQKALSLQVLRNFFPTYPMGNYGDWQKFSYGNADFFLLDSRSQRDPSDTPDGPNKSMLDGNHLGASGQWDWLTQGLLNSTARWKFIFSPVVFNPTVPKDDAWHGYPDERARLIQFIHDHHIKNVVILSGDLHMGGIDDGTNSGFPEMVVPPPNGRSCLTAPKPGKWSAGIYLLKADFTCPGYGVVTVQTNPSQVTLQVKDQAGNTVVHTVVKEQ